MRKPKRIEPRLSPAQLQTFQVTSPISTHTKPASCEDVECEQYLRGWRMTLDLKTQLGAMQGRYIKYESGRSFTYRDLGDSVVELTFGPNQPCFQEHRVPIGRPEIYRVKGGDYRGNPLKTLTRVHKKPEFWVEEFAENQDRLKTAIEKG